MNTICLGMPLLSLASALRWGITSQLTWIAKAEAYDAFLVQVRRGKDPTQSLIHYTAAGHAFIEQFRGACLAWSIVALISILVRTLNISMINSDLPNLTITRDWV